MPDALTTLPDIAAAARQAAVRGSAAEMHEVADALDDWTRPMSGAELVRIRVEVLDQSLHELAAALGTDQPSLSHMEHGRRPVPAKVALRLRQMEREVKARSGSTGALPVL